MAGLNHDFYLANVRNIPYDQYWRYDEMQEITSIPDDHLHYMIDTLFWIATYNPDRRENRHGLCWFGPTVINIDGAPTAVRILNAWADLFSAGAGTLRVHGSWIYDEEHPNGGDYQQLEIPRDETVEKLQLLASYMQKVVESDGELYILHRGI
jgi:hypothetical protein